MKKPLISALAALAALSFSASAQADLPVGAKAPNFSTQGALAGKDFGFKLSSALKRGPVVLYFFPKAFTKGCTMEAHAFAEAIDDFKALGASVIGMSNDNLPTLQRFSTQECRSKFPVAVATPAIIKAYDVALKPDMLPAGVASRMPTGLADRTSYVIAPDGRIVFVHSDLDYRDHVRLTLEAVRALKAN
jgi:peroxiredoxin